MKKGKITKKTRKIMSALLIGTMVLSPFVQQEAKAASINKKKVTISVGQQVKLKIKGTKKKIKWVSKKAKVATVNAKGKVIAKSNGTAKIIAKVGKKRFVCVVRVVKSENNGTLQTSVTPTPTAQLGGTSVPSTATPTPSATTQTTSTPSATAQTTSTPSATTETSSTPTPTTNVSEKEDNDSEEESILQENVEEVYNESEDENDEYGVDDANDNERDQLPSSVSAGAVSAGTITAGSIQMGAASNAAKRLFSLPIYNGFTRTDAIAIYGDYVFVLKDKGDGTEDGVFFGLDTEFRLECYRKDNSGKYSDEPIFKKKFTADNMYRPKGMTYYDGKLYIATHEAGYAMCVPVNLTGREFGGKSRCYMENADSIPCNGISYWKEKTNESGEKVAKFIIRGKGNKYYVYDLVDGKFVNKVKCDIPKVKGYTSTINDISVKNGTLYVATHNNNNRLKNKVVGYDIETTTSNGETSYSLEYDSLTNINAKASSNTYYVVKGIAVRDNKVFYCTNETDENNKNSDGVYRKEMYDDVFIERDDDDYDIFVPY